MLGYLTTFKAAEYFDTKATYLAQLEPYKHVLPYIEKDYTRYYNISDLTMLKNKWLLDCDEQNIDISFNEWIIKLINKLDTLRTGLTKAEREEQILLKELNHFQKQKPYTCLTKQITNLSISIIFDKLDKLEK